MTEQVSTVESAEKTYYDVGKQADEIEKTAREVGKEVKFVVDLGREFLMDVNPASKLGQKMRRRKERKQGADAVVTAQGNLEQSAATAAGAPAYYTQTEVVETEC